MIETWCINCANVHAATVEMDPWRWRCVKVPIRPGFGFVHPHFAPDPPYALCSKTNTDGQCKFYEPSRAYEQT